MATVIETLEAAILRSFAVPPPLFGEGTPEPTTDEGRAVQAVQRLWRGQWFGSDRRSNDAGARRALAHIVGPADPPVIEPHRQSWAVE